MVRLQVPGVRSVVADELVGFAAEMIDRSGVAALLEQLTTHRTGRRRQIPVRALLVGMLVLALDGRPLCLKDLARLLYEVLPQPWRDELGLGPEVTSQRALLARYRCLRYLFHTAVEPLDCSLDAKNRVIPAARLKELRRKLSDAEVRARRALLESVLAHLLDASVSILDEGELDAFDGSVGLDATPVPLWSRGPSKDGDISASDPDGGWYVRQPDRPRGDAAACKPRRTKAKSVWALEATIVTSGRPAGSAPGFPNLVLAICLERPAVDPAGTGVRLLASVRERGYRAGWLAADRGYTQAKPEDFALPVRVLGYSLVMDYKEGDLGLQGSAEGAILVEGSWYCPAMPQALVSATADLRQGRIDDATAVRLIGLRQAFALRRKQGPDADGYERWCCPAGGGHPKVCCALRPRPGSLGLTPVPDPPALPPKVCSQGSVTIAPDAGARFRQELAFGSPEWAATYAAYRNTIEGLNGFIKDTAHEALAEPGRRRVRGIAAQSIFCTLLAMAANVRKIESFRHIRQEGTAAAVAARAKRRRVSIERFKPPPAA